MIERLGQLFITGFDTEKPSDEFLEFIGKEGIGGVILFEPNCNPHSLAEDSIKQIQSVSAVTPFIGVDQEGGRVCRFRGVPAEYEAPSIYGEKENLELFTEHYERAVYYLNSLGINLVFGPVADLNLNKANACIKGRTFGQNPAKVIPFIDEAVRLAGRAGIISCLKHFPGFGAACNDPHQKMAVAKYDFQTFVNREALTFKAGIAGGADMIMTTHMILSAFDDYPVTVSELIIRKLLRETLDFDGIAITDDLLMGGAEELGPVGERALKAFQAGHDMLLFGSDFRAAREALQYFKKAYRNGHVDKSRVGVSLDRISGIKSKLIIPVT
ncbi:putative Beta-D-glucosidase [Candidatus Zixiibacteriota bacterium]|nr:putative Beta-D-glucosidase [candidate division Zixibacteria bacterium]